MITKKIHQVYISDGDIIPAFKPEWRESWQNKFPEWDYKLWRKEDISSLLEKYPEYLETYNKFDSDVYATVLKADFIRQLILYDEGGIYADLDCICVHNFEDIIKDSRFFIQDESSTSRPKNIGVHLEYSEPKHSFLKFMLDRMKGGDEKEGVLSRTGPRMAGLAYKDFEEKNTITIHNEKNFCRWVKHQGDEYLFNHDVERHSHSTSGNIYVVHASRVTWGVNLKQGKK